MNSLTPTHTPARILIVDDDDGIRDLVAQYLARHGFEVDGASDPTAMRARLAQQPYALIVLDVMMPGEDGLTALRKLQKSGGPPVIMLSAMGTDVDRIIGLEIGAEDYLAKPCNPRELLARIRTVLRRNREGGNDDDAPTATVPAVPSADTDVLHFAGWCIDLSSRTLHDPHGAPVALSDGEFRLLRAFVRHPRRVLTRDQLLDYARGSSSAADNDSFDRAIDVQVSRLRRRLRVGDEAADLIRTVRHEGYLFVPPVSRG